MSLKIYDSATHAVRDFEPLRHGRVGLYLCGPGAEQLAKCVQPGMPGHEFFRNGKEKRLDHDDPAASGGNESAQQRIKRIQCICEYGSSNRFSISMCHNISDIIDPAEQKDGIKMLPAPHPLPFATDTGEREAIHTAIDERKIVVVAGRHPT